MTLITAGSYERVVLVMLAWNVGDVSPKVQISLGVSLQCSSGSRWGISLLECLKYSELYYLLLTDNRIHSNNLQILDGIMSQDSSGISLSTATVLLWHSGGS